MGDTGVVIENNAEPALGADHSRDAGAVHRSDPDGTAQVKVAAMRLAQVGRMYGDLADNVRDDPGCRNVHRTALMMERFAASS